MVLSRFLVSMVCLSLLVAGSVSAQSAIPATPSAVIDELSLKGTDIAEALSLISQKSGLNIIAGRNVEGAVTVFLKNVDAKEALRTVAEASGLAFADEGRIIRFMTNDDYLARYGHSFGQEKTTRVIKLNFVAVKDLVSLLSEVKSPSGKVIPNEESKSIVLIDSAEKVKAMDALIQQVDVQTVTSILVLQHARAEEVLEKVRGMVTQSVGGISCDPRANTLTVTDTLAKVERIRRLVEDLDARGRKIVVQAKLVHIVLNDEHLNGVEWDGIVSDFQGLSLGAGYDFLDASARKNSLSLGTIVENEFSTLIEALDTVGFTKEYPLSDVAVALDTEARIIIKIDEPYLGVDAVKIDAPLIPAGGGAVAFWVKPVVDADGNVQTLIRAPDGFGKASGVTVHSRQGDMIVLGSMIATERYLTARKVPLVGDLPLLGFAFRYHNRSIRREEFVVFLTLKVVSPQPQVSPVVAAAAGTTGVEGTVKAP